ncbi:MAG TPA: SprT-like domain-containing protein [Agriterribacter sp.]|nr:SprT-like domain-containing protein [Agriterribacter sp.]HRQ51900.1 SprT-like domain-containing protein [Agriterribacter sp.]
MRKKNEAPLVTLNAYLPAGAYHTVMQYLQHYKVHLTITRERRSVLGDYRFAVHGKNHRISVNGNLNAFAFLITLLHELAHLIAFEKYGNRIVSHGKEWKQVYGEILHQFLLLGIFPPDIAKEIKITMRSPAAGSCAEDGLIRVLRKYDGEENDKKLVEEISVGASFRTDDGRIFKRGDQLRKRIRCIEIKTGKIYLFSPVYEVTPVSGT